MLPPTLKAPAKKKLEKIFLDTVARMPQNFPTRNETKYEKKIATIFFFILSVKFARGCRVTKISLLAFSRRQFFFLNSPQNLAYKILVEFAREFKIFFTIFWKFFFIIFPNDPLDTWSRENRTHTFSTTTKSPKSRKFKSELEAPEGKLKIATGNQSGGTLPNFVPIFFFLNKNIKMTENFSYNFFPAAERSLGRVESNFLFHFQSPPDHSRTVPKKKKNLRSERNFFFA